MRKIWLALFAFGCVACATRAHAEVDMGLYPFAEICGDEIDNYCVDAGDALGDCMVANYDMLGDDCGDAVFFWAGEHYGWRDPEIHDRWDGMTARERHEYVISHSGYLDEFRAHSTHPDYVPQHVSDHLSPADAAEFREIDNYDGGMHAGGHPEMGGHMGGGMGGGMRR